MSMCVQLRQGPRPTSRDSAFSRLVRPKDSLQNPTQGVQPRQGSCWRSAVPLQ